MSVWTWTSTPIHARAWKEKALAGYNSQQIPTNNNTHKMLIIIISLRWKHFVIISYLYKIPTINEPYNQRKRDIRQHIPIFSQLNITHRWLSIVFHIEFEELHNADKSIVDKYNNWCKASKLIAPALTTIWSLIFKMDSWKKQKKNPAMHNCLLLVIGILLLS